MTPEHRQKLPAVSAPEDPAKPPAPAESPATPPESAPAPSPEP
jgi:hypothetical protein